MKVHLEFIDVKSLQRNICEQTLLKQLFSKRQKQILREKFTYYFFVL